MDWIVELLDNEPSLIKRKMFGCLALYLNGLLCFVIAEGDEPWNGLLVSGETLKLAWFRKKRSTPGL